jgi:hypothetical protein
VAPVVKNGFRPKNIKMFKHKFGLNTFAIRHKTATGLSITEPQSRGGRYLMTRVPSRFSSNTADMSNEHRSTTKEAWSNNSLRSPSL